MMTIEEVKEKIQKTKAEIEYEENRLQICGHGKNDLAYVTRLKFQLEELYALERILEEEE